MVRINADGARNKEIRSGVAKFEDFSWSMRVSKFGNERWGKF
jgi:hypothetical protein